MKDITIDCRELLSRPELHRSFAQALALPEHYGNTLDALHDCLTDIAPATRIRLLHWTDAEKNLGSYARSAKRAILDAATENPNLAVIFD